MALGCKAHLLEDTSAMDKLIQFYTDRCFDKETHQPKQHFYDNLSEQYVNQASSDLPSPAPSILPANIDGNQVKRFSCFVCSMYALPVSCSELKTQKATPKQALQGDILI